MLSGGWANSLQTLSQVLVLTLRFTFDPGLDNYQTHLFLFSGGILYLNNILGYQMGFSNITSQIQNLNSDVSQFKSEIISKIEVKKQSSNIIIILN